MDLQILLITGIPIEIEKSPIFFQNAGIKLQVFIFKSLIHTEINLRDSCRFKNTGTYCAIIAEHEGRKYVQRRCIWSKISFLIMIISFDTVRMRIKSGVYN